MTLESTLISTVVMSESSLAELAREIESELSREPAYVAAVAAISRCVAAPSGSVQTIATAAENAQTLVKAVAKAAIKLALEKVAAIAPKSRHQDNLGVAAAENTDGGGKGKFLGFGQLPLSKPQSQNREEAAADRWRVAAIALGRQLREARMARGMSLSQLQMQTMIPLHHLKALEDGCADELPEDVFTRNFIRRIGNALGLDGAAMAAQLPAPTAPPRVVPAWQGRNSPSVSGFGNMPMYLGYTALMAGAIAGLGHLANSSAAPEPTFPDAPPQDNTQWQRESDSRNSITCPIEGCSIAPPEYSSQ
ncbi:MAG TPA: helix-turn-helix domain-containing protein [Oscillatoriaceae cyanobacterium M33_DOE_052]|uniref:Helix-turn-helix domain-containing protein n=1 Tax=Planktothricoides sp. SpSt-374 TaxID=2282167 RepID=A0A7C3VID8_9CYAN|nr:helix-turn-helix domain-containing protein [Oscillatoriaceae cyanobacterium M33_DOE_052]